MSNNEKFREVLVFMANKKEDYFPVVRFSDICCDDYEITLYGLELTNKGYLEIVEINSKEFYKLTEQAYDLINETKGEKLFNEFKYFLKYKNIQDINISDVLKIISYIKSFWDV